MVTREIRNINKGVCNIYVTPSSMKFIFETCQACLYLTGLYCVSTINIVRIMSFREIPLLIFRIIRKHINKIF
jgi:hypothetical protein